MIPITKVVMPPEVEELVIGVLRSGGLAQGAMVERFEQQFADLLGLEHAVAVNSGTTALVASIQALGIGPGDEIITSPFTFVATLNAIIEAGARCVFADVSLDDGLIATSDVEERLTGRTRALMPVHLYGQMADMRALGALAATHGLRIIEDAAQAHGAIRDGLSAGTADVGCFSLYSTKNITTAEGGMITTGDPELAASLRVLRNQGMRERYNYVVAGHNYRMTDVHAAIGLGQLPYLTEWTEQRRQNARRLVEGLADVPGLVMLKQQPNSRSAWHQFTVRITDQAAIERDVLVEVLHERGIGSGVYYPRAVYDYDCYRSHPNVLSIPMPNAERLAREVISLPVHPHLTDHDVDRVIEEVRRALDA